MGSRRVWRRVCRSCLAVPVLMMSLATAQAQAPTPTGADRAVLQQQYDVLFDQVLRDPGNLDLSFRLADLAIRLGDYEGAIAALDRMLLFNPDLPRVRLELGVLYFRLGAYDVARQYFERAVAGDDIPEEVRRRVDSFLAEIEERTRVHRFAGSIYFGGRYQTNANSGPASRDLRIEDLEVLLDENSVGAEDVNLFAAFSGTHVYDLGTQHYDVLETNVTAYGGLYAEEDELDLAYLEVETGPRLALLPDRLPGTTIRPYLVGSYVFLDDATYFSGVGAGIRLARNFSDRLTGSVGFEHRFRWFNDTDGNPTASERDGHLDQLRFDARWAATPRDIIAGSLYGVYNNADAGFRSYGEHGGRLAYTRLFEPLFGAEARPLALTGAVGYRATDYDDPDPLVAPGTTRRDREWRVSGLASVGLAADWDLVVEVEYREVDSNIELYEFDNFAVTVGGIWHF